MNNSDYKRLGDLFSHGKLEELTEELKPFLEKGDLDARFLNAHFSVEDDEDFDMRRAEEISALAGLAHGKSMYVLAWMHRHGDDVEQDYEKFLLWLMAAAATGHEIARQDLNEIMTDRLGIPGNIQSLH